MRIFFLHWILPALSIRKNGKCLQRRESFRAFLISLYNHKPNENLIGFWAHDREEVVRIAELVVRYGGTIDSGPWQFPISPTYYAVYFQDPCGNKYEMVHRLN
ncbi:VOC family protein [Caldalkalibacillus thermarum]|uniref:VOC family protein n=1 Tax=Caldalkalibacillus thermarum TaxID=296745 RepID=UPI00308424FC